MHLRITLLGLMLLLCAHLLCLNQHKAGESHSTVDYSANINTVLNTKLAKVDSAINANQSLNNIPELARLWNDKGNLYSKQSYYKQSYECYKKALALYEKVEDYVGIGNCYINFARLSDEADMQLKYYRRALSHFKKAGHPLGAGKVLNNIGVTYEESMQFDSARHYFTRALFIANDLGFPMNRAACLTNLGNLAFREGNCDDALPFLKGAEIIFDSLSAYHGLAYTLGKKGEAHDCLNQPDSAFFYYQKQLDLAISKGLRPQLLSALHSMKSFHEGQGDLKAALKFANEVMQLEKEIAEDSKLEYADMLTYEREAQDKNQLLEKVQNEKRLSRMLNIAISFSAVLIIALILLSLQKLRSKIRQNRIIVKQKEALIQSINQKHEQEIRFKNKELRQLSNYILHKREFVELIKNQVTQIKNLNLPPDVSKKVNEAISILNTQLNLTQDNEMLQASMAEIQKNFLLQLKDTYPKLTSRDIKLLSLLSINLSSKDIAPIMGISVESVHTKRYRLRKKLDLPPDVSFGEFLQKMT